MMTSPEQDPTVQDSAADVSAPAETASSDASLNVAKEDSSASKSAEDESGKDITAKKDTKRYLPAHKKTNAALTFPEKMMNLMRYVDERNRIEKEFCISWLPEGKAFVIYNIKDFTNNVIPKFFKASKFCSFTRKLYRWGFRQLNRGIGPEEPIIFGNEYFQRDNADLMVNMRSITAASIRQQQEKLIKHLVRAKQQASSLDGAMNGAYQDSKYRGYAESKHRNLILNSTPFDQKQNNASLSSAATMLSLQRYGSLSTGSFSTGLANVDDHSLERMYQSLTNKGSSSESGTNTGLNDAMSQMNNSTYGSSHAADFNSMSSMHNPSNGLMGGASSNYISGNSGMIDANVGNNGYSGSLSNGMFSTDYGSSGNRGLVGASDSGLGKSFMSGKHNFHANGAVHDNGSFGGGYSNLPMNMNINQHLFNLSATSGTSGGSDDLYYGGQQF